ncbi:Protein of unknown function (DUF2795) [Parafrankia irregularis]|uniref:DUF2795 domain-containing protein n=1 Tax=Parafrankia irregularis TaxID=795642 RepID=A0A0S4QL03_9ACTN|nr:MULTISPECIES: DUF2795 domain-containing protein [Parafrankia]MBE3201332.1 DUF2795 domain-containing protein [Parafrankia sp. CH37]CUU56215.1 Protein of unknown function (DUF2795) [Parafrankia irregularis]
MANPIEVQKFLKGIDYPADRRTLVETARQEGASREVVAALEHITDRSYDGPNAVSQEVSHVSIS